MLSNSATMTTLLTISRQELSAYKRKVCYLGCIYGKITRYVLLGIAMGGKIFMGQ